MSELIAALPMYDFPELRVEVDRCWMQLHDAMRSAGIDAPDALTRSNGALPAVPGGIRASDGAPVAPDPASLLTDELNLPTLWRHPKLLFAQTCWGPMNNGLETFVHVLGQPDYSAYEGGEGELYSSAVVMRGRGMRAPQDGSAFLPLDLLRGKRFAYNGPDSMSGLLALKQDLEAKGETLDIFAERIETGGHRLSAIAVAEGRADVCALDCRSWDFIRRHEPKARGLVAVGWTKRRKGLPYICSRALPSETVETLRRVVAENIGG